MIICMSDIIVVTNRLLCSGDFSERMEKLAAERPKGIILREKDLSEREYKLLAEEVTEICKKYVVPCILHNFARVAKEVNGAGLHLPLHVLRSLSQEESALFTTLGASCHSAEDALEAERMGCTYITAGHVFDTNCKKGLPGRGLAFLQEVCEAVSIPVYAIGGIDADNIAEVRKAGAAGACVMSGAMMCADAHGYFAAFKENKNEV